MKESCNNLFRVEKTYDLSSGKNKHECNKVVFCCIRACLLPSDEESLYFYIRNTVACFLHLMVLTQSIFQKACLWDFLLNLFVVHFTESIFQVHGSYFLKIIWKFYTLWNNTRMFHEDWKLCKSSFLKWKEECRVHLR